MEIKGLIESLKNMLPEKVDYADLVCAEGFAHGYTYVYEDPEPYFIEEAINTLEKLYAENKRLRNDLIMPTALAQNIQNTINNNKEFEKQFKVLLKDFKEFILNHDDVCEYCKYNQPCRGEKCDAYIKGKDAWDHNGCKHDWEWSCEDFNFGECPKLENTPCNGCIKNNMRGFEWRGVS
jgi:hypothetical protein